MKIIFEYSSIFDEYIAELQKQTLDETKLSLVETFVPKLNDHWEMNGNRLLKTASKLSGFAFKLSHLKCTVSIGDFVSMSHPFIVNVGKYLDSSDLDILEETIFHEALHILLTDNWKVWPTEMIKKHGGSDPEIDAHLHLMSLELATHLHHGDSERLEKIDSWYGRIGGGYLSAWSLVKSNNLYFEFIQELGDPTQWQTVSPSSLIQEKNLAFR